MKKHLRADKAGAAPGTLLYVGQREAQPTLATLIEYGPEPGDFVETQFTAVEQGRVYQPKYPVLWLNLHGLENQALLQLVGERFRLHPLTLEDILNTQQRPKVEAYPHYLFITVRLHSLDENGNLEGEQVSIVLGRGFVLTFQEKPTGTFAGLREGLRRGESLVRRFGADYLVYSILDKLVDRDFTVLERLGDISDDLEDEMLESGTQPGQLRRLQQMRRSLQGMRRGLWPLRELINTLQRDEQDYFHDETQLYLRDVYDHSVQLIETVETLREALAGQQDTYHSLQGHKLNLQMRRLTVITIVFMPLTLITGIFGMNFEHMPGLKWQWGFGATMLAMALITTVLTLLFRNRRWM
ncbi:magnesium/cobalt transporter CorA [Chitinilyticum piscinae]|uniref:Magnesium transport protein CorA n=1 Tax=Chitinilyticum piscinae TaxID=2866724 RepID=A0A8J7FM94_9NEIS|nr:magnesium/cobalt transporter CorA [Chitinilyticum piscinae]MBE9609016.1 magnesium/cobalt transporter CorA [Chitinilyticum piscinae]